MQREICIDLLLVLKNHIIDQKSDLAFLALLFGSVNQSEPG